MIKFVKANMIKSYYNISQAKIIEFKIAGNLYDRDKGDIILLKLAFDTQIDRNIDSQKMFNRHDINYIDLKSDNYYKFDNLDSEEFFKIIQKSFEDFLMNQSENIFFFDTECNKAYEECKLIHNR